jgi:hypothetical protein
MNDPDLIDVFTPLCRALEEIMPGERAMRDRT